MHKLLLLLLLFNTICINAQIDGDPDIGDLSAPGTFYDKFESPLDTNVWNIHNRVWGQPSNSTYQHGGVITENCYTENGNAVMRSLGDYYTGPLRGANGRSTRIGGAMYTKQTFASGRYEIKMKALQRPNMGVLSSPWTFRYEKVTQAEDPVAYNKALSKGANVQNNAIFINSEIDIELKGTNLANPIMKHWLTVERSAGGATQLPVNLNDGEFHIYRWDWHTGGHGEQARVEYYVDNVLYRTITQYVPYISANMTIGNWFAWWASLDLNGSYQPPLYDTDYVYVDWIKIVPFYEAEDDWLRTEGQRPYPNWVAHKIPGGIDAVNFDRGGKGIAYHDVTNVNSGSGIRQDEFVDTNSNGSIESLLAGEWLEYTVHVKDDNAYDIGFDLASANSSPGSFRLDVDGTDVTGTVKAINTGGNTIFKTKKITDIMLSKGQHVIRLYVLEGGFSLNKIKFSIDIVQEPYPDASTPHTIPGTIMATDYDTGGQGVAYHDTTTGNTGSGPRQNEDVDTAYDDGGKPAIGWGSTSEWQEYTVDVAQSGNYTAIVRVASAVSTPGSFRIDIDGTDVSGSVNAITTGSWTNFQEVTINNISLTVGQHILRFNNIAGGFNWSKVTFTYTGSSAKSNFVKLLSSTNTEEDVISRIYPNPVFDRKLNIHINQVNRVQFDLSIYTISGLERFKVKIKSGENFINLPKLSAGIYLIRITNSNGYRKTEKLVIL